MRKVDDIRLCIVYHLHGNSIHAVDAADRLHLFLAVIHLGDILQLHLVAALSHHQLLDLGNILVFSVQVYKIAQPLLFDKSAILPLVHIAGEGVSYARRRDVVGIAHLPVENDIDRFLPSAKNVDRCSAVNIQQFGHNVLIRKIAHPVHPAIAQSLQGHQYVRPGLEVHLLHAEGEIVRQTPAQRGDPLIELEVGIFQVGALLIIDHHRTPPAAGSGFYPLNILQGGNSAFNRNDRLLLHVFGGNIGAGVDLHVEHRQGGIGDDLHIELLVRDVAQHGGCQEQHGDKDLPLYDKVVTPHAPRVFLRYVTAPDRRAYRHTGSPRG